MWLCVPVMALGAVFTSRQEPKGRAMGVGALSSSSLQMVVPLAKQVK